MVNIQNMYNAVHIFKKCTIYISLCQPDKFTILPVKYKPIKPICIYVKVRRVDLENCDS